MPTDGRFDVILDLAGNRPLRVQRAAPRGTLVLVGGEGDDCFTGGMGRTPRAVLWSTLLEQRTAMLAGFVRPGRLQALADLLEQPGITPAVDGVYPLKRAADVMLALVSGQVRETVVLRVAA